jgi:hypothetical protein
MRIKTVEALSAENERLRAELENHIMQLAAISTASIQNTEASAADRITAQNPYYSTAYADVCRAIDREMALRAELAKAEAACSELRYVMENVSHASCELEHANDCECCLEASGVREMAAKVLASTYELGRDYVPRSVLVEKLRWAAECTNFRYINAEADRIEKENQ